MDLPTLRKTTKTFKEADWNKWRKHDFIDWKKAGLDKDIGSKEWITKFETVYTQQLEFAASWMTQLLPSIGENTLEMICAPCSHDAGMNKLSRKLRLGSNTSTITQTVGILGQLNSGVRYFDIRPSLRGKDYWCGHYQYIKKKDIPQLTGIVNTFGGPYVKKAADKYHGGEGSSLTDVINDINTFTQTRHEVIVLQLSHAFNWNREKEGDEWHHSMNQEEWNGVFSQLKRIHALYVSPEGASAAVTKIKIKDLIGKGTSAVIIAVDPDKIQLSAEYAGRGFYHNAVLKPLKAEWLTHTQDSIEAICAFLCDDPILKIAIPMIVKISNSPYLAQQLYSITAVADYIMREDGLKKLDKFSPGKLPNFIGSDNIHDLRVLSIVLRGMGKALLGRDMFLKHEGGKWKFDPA